MTLPQNAVHSPNSSVFEDKLDALIEATLVLAHAQADAENVSQFRMLKLSNAQDALYREFVRMFKP